MIETINKDENFVLVIADTAIRSFRNQGDKDYILARKAYRWEFYSHFHWSGLQALEKYIKCILLFNRISSCNMGHNLEEGLKLLSQVEYVQLNESTIDTIHYFHTFGLNRYLTWSYIETEANLHKLDRAIWDIRKYCKNLNKKFSHKSTEILNLELEKIHKSTLDKPKEMYIPGGYLEIILTKKKSTVRKDLIWQNGYFFTKSRKTVSHPQVMYCENSPLTLSPQYAEELSKLIYLSKDEINAFKNELNRRLKSKEK
ncbi:hypothetical protein OQJ05_16705 [Fluoribacter gormanii]|uniref:hypothetical protein n=1 Tax=Fluoribacter gormanii TaxID=464 RepID=UPI0022437C3B|nr:hypothetical protein [Fluoribacter gormanii]MCW8445676.1 hypothetical protein [Fluoribacter gormanii]